MTIYAIKRLHFTPKYLVLMVFCWSFVSANVRADQPLNDINISAAQTDYMAMNNTDLSFWLNQYIGVGLDQRQLTLVNKDEAVTATNLVIGTQVYDRFIVSGNAGLLSWSANNNEYILSKQQDSLYWGLSTHWRLNKRISLKAQWKQIEFKKKEQRLLMGSDVKLNF